MPVHHFELYNLKEDPGEDNNIYCNNPEIAKVLKDKMLQWWKNVNAPEYLPAMYVK